eukprot:TRINITY_DN65895_c14_g1_i1.p1 TRINITY_DN65895_c14_g1~~TRINITY_DN65895_c14_g1_i1.p1  ORF type:complete len:699 (+),score=109.99 TRINITY_DN65895_c14_g1_i1:70-2166(+)
MSTTSTNEEHPLKRQRTNSGNLPFGAFATDLFTTPGATSSGGILPSPITPSSDIGGAAGQMPPPPARSPAAPATLLRTTADASAQLLHEQQRLSADARPSITVPVFAQWYRDDRIHPIEVEAFPEFFPDPQQPSNSCNNEATYRSYRDFMINVYRSTPNRYLTATEARVRLNGDASVIIRLHEFLEHWGLINHGHPETSQVSSWELAPSAYPIVWDTPTGIKPNDAVSYQDYVKKKQAKMNPEAESEKSWSDTELRKLLEAIEKHPENPNWNEVAKQVGGNHTAEDCLLHFLRLPIQDPFLDPPLINPGFAHKLPPLPEQDTPGPSPAFSSAPSPAFSLASSAPSPGILPAPFTKHNNPNPVLSSIAFLASLVSPAVANAAAAAALKELTAELQTRVGEEIQSYRQNNAPPPNTPSPAAAAAGIGVTPPYTKDDMPGSSPSSPAMAETKESSEKDKDNEKEKEKEKETSKENENETEEKNETEKEKEKEKEKEEKPSEEDGGKKEGEDKETTKSSTNDGDNEKNDKNEKTTTTTTGATPAPTPPQSTPTVHDVRISLPKNITDLIRQKIALNSDTLTSATSALLGAASVRAHRMAAQEEVSMQLSLGKAVEAQLRKLQLKLTQFNKLDEMVQTERQHLQEQRTKMFEQKVHLAQVQQQHQQVQQQAAALQQQQATAVAQQQVPTQQLTNPGVPVQQRM